MKRIITFALTFAMMTGLCAPALASGNTFTDVPAGQWYTSYVERAASNGWVNGIGGGKYAPNGTVTYAQYATMLCGIRWSEEVESYKAITQGQPWYMPYVLVCEDKGVFSGTKFDDCPDWDESNQPIPREAMAQMSANYLSACGLDVALDAVAKAQAIARIADYGSIDNANKDAVLFCYSMGLLSGYSDGRFGPGDTMTRAQAATVLCNAYDAIFQSDPDISQPDIPATSDVTVTPYCTPGSSPAVIGLHVVAPVSAQLLFSIEPAENYSGVVMPSNTDAYVYGTGDATFEPITFTEAGTYSFTIKEEEGMENYRYDAREWTVTVTVTGSMGAPVGTIGGQYDVSRYTVPADANKDGYITEAEVQAVLDALQVEFPGGTLWNDPAIWGTDRTSPNGYITSYGGYSQIHYYKSPALPNAYGCAAWAALVSDRIFGDLPKREITDAQGMQVGDLIWDKGSPHWMVQLGQDSRYPDYFTTTSAGSDATSYIGWEGRYAASYNELQAFIDANTFDVYTRYPAGEAPTGDMAVASATYTCSDGKTGDKASFISTCLNVPTWSDETVAKARKIMADMTLEEKVGQMFLVHYPSSGAGTVAQAKTLIDKYHLGGFLMFGALFKGNTPAGVRQKIADTQAASKIPLLITVDEEGGKVSRVFKPDGSTTTAAVTQNAEKVYGHAPFKGPQELKAAGGMPAVIADAKDKAAAAL